MKKTKLIAKQKKLDSLGIKSAINKSYLERKTCPIKPEERNSKENCSCVENYLFKIKFIYNFFNDYKHTILFIFTLYIVKCI